MMEKMKIGLMKKWLTNRFPEEGMTIRHLSNNLICELVNFYYPKGTVGFLKDHNIFETVDIS